MPSHAATRAPSALRLRYADIRARTEELVRPLALEDQVVQSMPDASPTKWHLAHTSWFFETFVLAPRVPSYRVFDTRFAALFNSYYHAVGERHPRPERGLLSRPTVAEVAAYRTHVDLWMGELLAGEHGALDAALTFRLELGLQHEQQHQELILTDVKHLLGSNPLLPAYRAPTRERLEPHPELAGGFSAFDGGLVELGFDGAGFAFDNERPRHACFVAPFELAREPVNCGEFRAFLEDGGYRRSELWLADGWDARQRLGWEQPLHWHRDGGDWNVYTLDGLRALVLDEPVCHVSFYEADAFARWRGARLPREEEWELAARAERIDGNLLDTGRLHPAPAVRAGQRIEQAFGDVWEWSASPYSPYPGFEPFAGVVGEYNGKWMSNRYVLRGGSCVTPAGHVRATYRNFFGPEARWQFSGLRLARSVRA
ncbi:MAG: ergothioneine biosynthesis protein EgtB [Planctomycetota bacterium]